MFIQLNQLYFDTAKIETLGMYELPFQDGYEMGILLNGQRYCIYNLRGYVPEELKQEVKFNLLGLLEQIVQCARVELKKIKVPEIDISKYVQPVVPEVKQGTDPEKEQIND